MKNVMDYFHREAEVCVCVTRLCSRLKKKQNAGTIKNEHSLNRRDGEVFIRSHVDRWHP